MDFDSPPLYVPTSADEENDSPDQTQLPSLFDPSLIHSIETEIDLDLVEEIAQDFDWVEDQYVKDTRATSGDILDEASLNHLLRDLGDDKDKDDEDGELTQESTPIQEDMEQSDDSVSSTHPELVRSAEVPRSLMTMKTETTKISHSEKLNRIPCEPALVKSEPAIDAPPSPVPSSTTTTTATTTTTSSTSASESEEPDAVTTDTKTARKRRMNIMLQRRLGRFHQRQRASDGVIPPEELKIAAKAAVAAVLDTSVSMDPEEVVSIARGLLVERIGEGAPPAPPSPVRSSSAKVMERKKIEKPKKKRSITPARQRKKKNRDDDPVEGVGESVELPDGDDAESRRQRRLIRNRMSAQLHRERKREAMDSLKREIEERDGELMKLRQELEQALSKNASLESSLNLVKIHYGPSTIDTILQQTPPSPPHLVNTSDSSSSDEDVPSSPISSSEIIPHTVLSSYPKGRKRTTLGELKPRKKKRNGSMLMMATLAVCAVVAIVTPWHSHEQPIQVTQQRVIPDVGMRRRLLSVSTESLIDEQDDTKNYLLSPIEMTPSLWDVDHASHLAPWTYTQSRELFDLNAEALGQIAAASLSLSTSIMALTSLLSNLSHRSPKLERAELIDDNVESVIGAGLRGSMKTKRTSSQESNALARTESMRLHQPQTPLDRPNGSSFMFCPSATASLSPHFIQMSGLDDVEPEWDQDFKFDSSFETTEAIPPPASVASESKALVPSLLTNPFKRYPLVKTSMGGDDPFMKILLPASSFGYENGNAPWVELGCHVLSARLVDGVEFRGKDMDDSELDIEINTDEVLEDEGIFTL